MALFKRRERDPNEVKQLSEVQKKLGNLEGRMTYVEKELAVIKRGN